ncbi:hypothetical protein JZP86_003589 [Salmonella enterica]|nr:hypothetical protein [Salmonella enterica]ECN3094777.1 hypothetical protein [Salmonella enterica subsp. enterica serovar Derby]EDW0316981.1 hypothetical protein [Salmonella enterica subsp. enterica serovar Havana]EGN7963974.1 hypothetical protein [Salmonella enterica]EGN7985789.1 hypothetical protein [Salmonella enterica]
MLQRRNIIQDPIGLDGGINPYSYVKNPLRFVDPFGLSSDCLWKPADIKNPKNWNGCEDFALWVQEHMGGEYCKNQT